MRIVLDTNVILSAYLTRGLARIVFERCLEEHEIFISAQILAELESRLRHKFMMPQDRVSAMMNYLKIACQVRPISDVDSASCRDQNDLHILGLALHSKADVIVSGDEDLLTIQSFQGIPIQSPRQFWDMERKKNPRLLSRIARTTTMKIHDKPPKRYRSVSKKAHRKK